MGTLILHLTGHVKHGLSLFVVTQLRVRSHTVAVPALTIRIDLIDPLKHLDRSPVSPAADQITRQMQHRLHVITTQNQHLLKTPDRVLVSLHRVERQAHSKVPIALVRIHRQRTLDLRQRTVPLTGLVKFTRPLRVSLRFGPIVHDAARFQTDVIEINMLYPAKMG
jgi:hypothetical protein